MKITKSWLEILLLKNTNVFENKKEDAVAFKALIISAIYYLFLIFLPLMHLYYVLNPSTSEEPKPSKGLEQFYNITLGIPYILTKWADSHDHWAIKLLRIAAIWPVVAAYSAIAFPLTIAATVGLAVLAAVTLPFTLLADGVNALVKRASAKKAIESGFDAQTETPAPASSAKPFGPKAEIRPINISKVVINTDSNDKEYSPRTKAAMAKEYKA